MTTREWSNIGPQGDDNTVLCPICMKGKVIGPTGISNGHMIRGHIDNLTLRVETTPDGFKSVKSASDGRGSEVGFACSFEQCEHVIEYRLRFHKGDVYLAWRESEAAPGDGMPRD